MSTPERPPYEWQSEFEESYDLPEPPPAEAFSAELLEETLEKLSPPRPHCAAPTDPLDTVLQGMAQRNQGCVLVVERGKLVGIFTERDLLTRVYGKLDPKRTPVGEVMTRDPEAVSFHDTVAVALNKMTVGSFRHVPLVDVEHRPVGVLSVKDMVAFFARNFPKHVLNVAPDPSLHHPGEPSGAA